MVVLDILLVRATQRFHSSYGYGPSPESMFFRFDLTLAASSADTSTTLSSAGTYLEIQQVIFI